MATKVGDHIRKSYSVKLLYSGEQSLATNAPRGSHSKQPLVGLHAALHRPTSLFGNIFFISGYPPIVVVEAEHPLWTTFHFQVFLNPFRDV